MNDMFCKTCIGKLDCYMICDTMSFYIILTLCYQSNQLWDLRGLFNLVTFLCIVSFVCFCILLYAGGTGGIINPKNTGEGNN